MSDEMKPCPFCGKPGKTYLADNGETWVMCSYDGCWFQPSAGAPGLSVRESGWNNRPVEDALRAQLDALQAKWDAIPWAVLHHCELLLTSYNRLIESVDTRNRADEMRRWLDANAPKGAAE